ncbi:shikimate dehydrogenase [Phenylobacterium sp.]|jgi:shikimate dehydrogenase|uniref:shikimate dehydrogenase n=1 Tax=Phenylobacterium sp. TaxID=1871053 RepID=UPI002E3535C4|nr:shikimate dehydrogenase [Phenylobacterium sp.]HEX2560495.1 shikimate dehydrogenase [Phenylobacterium sp.]
MITGATTVAGVVGSPVRHSLSPLIHNAWLAAAGVDGVYVPFSPPPHGFKDFVRGLRGGAVRGVNVTLPFKEEAMMAADEISPRADLAGASNLLIFTAEGHILADNTDGLGLLHAFQVQAPGFDPKAGPVVILGAGGAARGAAAAFVAAGAPEVRIVNRTYMRAEQIAGGLGSTVVPLPLDRMAEALGGVIAVINATSAGLSGDGDLNVPLEATPTDAVVMDMVYKPLRTPFLARAEAIGRRTVDGLEMLIGQAIPSFEAFFGRSPPAEVDVRALCLEALSQ